MVCTVYSTRLHLTWSVQTLPGCSSHGLNQAVAHMVCTVYSTLLHLIWSIQYRVVSDMVCAVSGCIWHVLHSTRLYNVQYLTWCVQYQAVSDMVCTVQGCIWHGLCSVQYQAVSDMFFFSLFYLPKICKLYTNNCIQFVCLLVGPGTGKKYFTFIWLFKVRD